MTTSTTSTMGIRQVSTNHQFNGIQYPTAPFSIPLFNSNIFGISEHQVSDATSSQSITDILSSNRLRPLSIIASNVDINGSSTEFYDSNIRSQTLLIPKEQNNNILSEERCSSESSPTTVSSSTESDSSTSRHVIVRNESGKRRKELVKDDAYWERRKKNNDAAKRSRDQRRQKEDEIAHRAVCLEQENVRLKEEIEKLRMETDQLKEYLLGQVVTPLIPSLPAPVAIRPSALLTSLSQPHSLHTTSSVISTVITATNTVPRVTSSNSEMRSTVLVQNPANSAPRE